MTGLAHSDQGDGRQPLWRMEGVRKTFGGVIALDGVDFSCRRGSIHAVLGENGAGKSTLIKIMAGVVAPDEGRMLLDGEPVALRHRRRAANAAGIACIFQELSLIPDLSVADNIAHHQSAAPLRADRPARAAPHAPRRRWRAPAPSDIHPLALVKDLPLSRRQMVEIAKALARKPRILILDEATSALTAADVAKVFAVLKRLRARGPGAPLHLAPHARDRRARRRVHGVPQRPQRRDLSRPARKTDNEVVEMMIGREYSHVFPPKPRARRRDAAPVLEVRDLRWTDRLQRHLAHASAPARSSASAASTARASASCCWRCSACCAASTRRDPDRRQAGRDRAARAAPSASASAWR